MLPTTRANAAMAIALRQYSQAKQANPEADDIDIIENLSEVPDTIKDFLKKKASSRGATSQNANLQNDNPLLGQQRIYQQITERLTRPYRPQMSEGRPVGGVQLPPQKALELLHNDPDFQSLPAEYQKYAIGVVGGQGALQLHELALKEMNQGLGLRNEANKDALNFSQSPTRMVQDRLEKGNWFVDADNRLKKKEKNPVSGMEEISDLTPWETLHAIREAPRVGFGDLSSHINPAQAAGLAALRANPNASVSDIVSMVSKGQPIANLQNGVPTRNPSLTPLDTTPSPERIATLRAMGVVPQSSPSGTFTDAELGASKAPWYNALVDSAPTAKLPAGYAAGSAVRNFVTGGVPEVPNLGQKALPYIGAGMVNSAAAVGKGITAGGNFLAGLFGQPQQQPAFGIDFTSPTRLKPAIDNMFQSTIPDWLLKRFGTDLSNPAQYETSPVEFTGP